MHPFTFARAEQPADAVAAAVADPKAKFVAGGTNLLDLMKERVEKPAKLIDINPLPLAGIEELTAKAGVRLGAMARNSDVADSRLIRDSFPLLSEALLAGATQQLRNMATVGGNLLQRTRCPYFTDVHSACNKRTPGSGCDAKGGFNRSCAVLGVSDSCIAAHPSDMCVALAALDATVRIAGAKGDRTVKFADFHLPPGDTPHKETVLEPGDLITAVDVPFLPAGVTSCYLKVRDRASYAFALVSVAAVLKIEAGKVADCRLALGGVGAKPWRAAEAEKDLVGQPANADGYKAAAEAALKGAKAASGNAFKIELAKRAIVRTLTFLEGRK
jgi:xanthine dehydrogenase YagS FAD-binding subunit